MPRLSSKDRYIKEVFNLYKRRGLHLNMEQIADELHITKKTLYNNFENKEDMMQTVVEFFFHGLESKMMASVDSSKNAIEALFMISATIRCEIDKLGEVLLDDLSKENIEMFVHSSRTSFYSRVIRENLKRGIEEKLYRSDLDIEYATLFYTSVIEMFYKQESSYRLLKKSGEFHSELVKHHLYSVVNTNSRVLLESYL